VGSIEKCQGLTMIWGKGAEKTPQERDITARDVRKFLDSNGEKKETVLILPGKEQAKRWVSRRKD